MWFFYFITKGISTHQKDVVCLEDFWQTFVLERKREREREKERARDRQPMKVGGRVKVQQ